jgi:hypothetical protein
MPDQGVPRSATRRSSATPSGRSTERSAADDREATRNRVLASLLMCPGARTSGRRNGVGTA